MNTGPQIDFCRCFGGMAETGRAIALYLPCAVPSVLPLALHKSFWGPLSLVTESDNVAA